MGSMSIVHWAILLAIVLLLFGAGRLPSVMGDFAKGIKAFKAGMKDEDDKPGNAGPGSIAQTQAVPAHGQAAEVQTVGGDRRVG